MSLPAVRRPHLVLHAALFGAVVVGVATLAMLRAVNYQPRVDDALVDGRLARAFESHYDRQFPARDLGISLWAALDYLLFDEAMDGAVVGADGWLYTEEEFSVPADARVQVQRNLDAIVAIRDRLQAQGCELVVALVPAKARVYPDHLLRRRPPPLREALYSQAHARLLADYIEAPDLRPVLIDGRRDGETFLRTDTHWTPLGAARVAEAVAEALRRQLAVDPQYTQRFVTTTAGKQRHAGDLLSFLPLAPYFDGRLPPPDEVSSAMTQAQDGGDLLGDTRAPRIALVGTSYSADAVWNFAGDLRQQLSEDVGNYARDGLGPFQPMRDYLDSGDFRQSPPRAVIWEIPERYLPYERPPELAAPVAPAA